MNESTIFLTEKLIEKLEKVNDFFKAIMPNEKMIVEFGDDYLRFINAEDLNK